MCKLSITNVRSQRALALTIEPDRSHSLAYAFTNILRAELYDVNWYFFNEILQESFICF